MSVLIQGMEMPTSCSVCEFTHRMHHGELVCRLLNVYASEVDMEEECPLIDVPLHGRLIDADRFDVFAYDSEAAKKYGDTFDGGIEYVLDVIAQSDTIIPADKED